MPYIILLLLSGLFLCSCSDDKDKAAAAFQEKVEHTRTVLSNGCTQDSDCIVTGCHHNICRAAPEPDYCEQRLVMAMDEATDLATIKQIIENQLTVRESESVRIGGYAAGLWTVSFSADLAHRARMITLLNTISLSGLVRLHPDAQSLSDSLAASLHDPDTSLRSLRGAGKLVEKQIRAGDVLSKDDIHTAWMQIAQTLENLPNTPKEMFWAYDVITDAIPYLRMWPIDSRQRITIRQWSDVDLKTDNGDIILTATLDELAASTLEQWTMEDSIIALVMGQEVIASAVPNQTIENGRFEIVVHDAAQNEFIYSNFLLLKSVAQMEGTVRIDDQATQKVERDLFCNEQFPRTCACVAGTCSWRNEKPYNTCLYQTEE